MTSHSIFWERERVKRVKFVKGHAMKSVGKFLALLAVLCLFIGVASGAKQDGKCDQVPEQGSKKNAMRSNAISPRAAVGRQKQHPVPACSRTANADPQFSSLGIDEPPFLGHALLFAPDSTEVSAGNTDALKRAASWLGEHHEARVLVVGFCDPSGSEICTDTLARKRGAVVRKYLLSFGARSDQIAGVKVWETVGRDCSADTGECQQLNRSAQIFVASPAPPMK
jgi:outer membrane protein OmpA-like peptidoglycan-associated protein